jgi:hypothetical protein
VLAITPAAVTVLVPGKAERAAPRSVLLNGPIQGFRESHNRIQVRLHPAANDAEREARNHIVVRSADGVVFTIPLKPGQTWASAELPADIASAAALEISVD